MYLKFLNNNEFEKEGNQNAVGIKKSLPLALVSTLTLRTRVPEENPRERVTFLGLSSLGDTPSLSSLGECSSSQSSLGKYTPSLSSLGKYTPSLSSLGEYLYPQSSLGERISPQSSLGKYTPSLSSLGEYLYPQSSLGKRISPQSSLGKRSETRGSIRHYIRFITAVYLMLMISTMAFADDTATTETCANGAGTVVTGAVSGHKYCLRKSTHSGSPT